LPHKNLFHLMKVTKNISSKALKEAIVKGMQELNAHDIVCVDLRKIPSAVTDFFVICHGNSSTQVEAISRSIAETTLKDINQKPWNQEGKTNAEWILLDYVDVVAHVFYSDAREFYNIEGLWGDAQIEKIEDVTI